MRVYIIKGFFREYSRSMPFQRKLGTLEKITPSYYVSLKFTNEVVPFLGDLICRA